MAKAVSLRMLIFIVVVMVSVVLLFVFYDGVMQSLPFSSNFGRIWADLGNII